ncbi:MAG: hypothetical protein Q8O89_03780 [Nanoarchaeota archaeon]|nr:hypothetical protein [Nanoarchaeota archaeon]
MERYRQKRFYLVFVMLFSLLFSTALTYGLDVKKVGTTVKSGSSDGGVLGEVTGALFGDIDFAQFYMANSGIIDFILLSMIFIGLSYFGLSKTFMRDGSTNAGKAVMLAVGIALAFGANVLMSRNGLTIASFGPIAMIILFILLAFTFYEIAKGLGLPGYIAGAFAYLLVYFTVASMTMSFEWLRNNAPILMSLMNLVKAGCIILALYGLFTLFMNAMRGIKAGAVPPVASAANPAAVLADAERRDRRQIVDERRAQTFENEAAHLNQQEERLNRAQLSDENAEIGNLRELSGVLRELSSTARRIEEQRRGPR